MRLKSPIFITSKRNEAKKANYYKSNNNTYEEEKIIKLLNDKIIIRPKISNIFNYKSNKKRSYSKLKSYIDDASLLKSSLFIIRQKKKLKQMKVENIFTYSNTFYKINNNDIDNNKEDENKNSLRNYYNILENDDKSKIFKSPNKKKIKNKFSDYMQFNNWRKNYNCALKFRFNRNQKSIDKVTSKIIKIDNKSKIIFDKFKREAENIFDGASIIKEIKKKEN